MSIMSSGWLERLGQEAKLLYFFLCLVADARGISYYGDARLSRLLGLTAPELAQARAELCRCDLLAFDGHIFQLLSLPPESTPKQESADTRHCDSESVFSGNELTQIRGILRSLGERNKNA